MKSKHFYKLLLLLSVIVASVSCSSNNSAGEEDPILTVSTTAVTFEPEGGTSEIEITTNGTWAFSNPATSWLQTNRTSGGSGTIVLTALHNGSGYARSVILAIETSNGLAKRVTVTQTGNLYPDYNLDPIPADASGMGSNAVELAAKIKLGWNIGNTLEATGGENAWGNPNITKEYVTAIKNLGFKAIRLPCSWNQHADQTTAKIDQAWMNRVKEVVQYCVDNDMYVLLNIHWDGGWLENNCTSEKKESVNAKQKAFWEQIATAMRDFDEHLMFASANEPDVDNAVEMGVLHSYHQTFVNAVRSTGGRNSYRVLLVQGPSTNIEKSNELMDMPTDEIEGRLIAEIHYYSPSQFCFLKEDVSWGNMAFYWGNGYHSTIEPDRNATYGEEDAVDASMALAKAKFVENGIPVIMGEYGAYRRNNDQYVPKELELHNNSVDHWLTYVTKKALANGLIPFYWDTGGAVDRQNYTVKDQRTIDAIIAGSN
ncbi:MAG TPA: cellulase family glycosylhydrolase [Flavobacteriaceae bacterium]|nr:cellulase family glycosylhydrolase [Flavobacteriaceae bacterium]